MKFFNKLEEIDPHLYEECDQKGKVERIDYHTTTLDGQPMDKYAFVYTPYNYDPSQPYEICYLIHGTGENAEKYIYLAGEENPLKRAVDNMIKEKTIKPIIIVTPTQYPYNVTTGMEVDRTPFVINFHNEMCYDLMPAVEGKYHTYSNLETDAESLKAARDHRSVMGWSMGSRTTWFTFVNKIAYFSKFGTLAGALVSYDNKFDAAWGDAKAKEIVEAVKAQGFTKDDYALLNISGTKDNSYFSLCIQDACLKAYPEYFQFEGEGQNISFQMWADGEHHTKWRLQYTINAIKQFHLL